MFSESTVVTCLNWCERLSEQDRRQYWETGRRNGKLNRVSRLQPLDISAKSLSLVKSNIHQCNGFGSNSYVSGSITGAVFVHFSIDKGKVRCIFVTNWTREKGLTIFRKVFRYWTFFQTYGYFLELKNVTYIHTFSTSIYSIYTHTRNILRYILIV